MKIINNIQVSQCKPMSHRSFASVKNNQAPVIAKKCEARLRQSNSASNALIKAYYAPSFAGSKDYPCNNLNKTFTEDAIFSDGFFEAKDITFLNAEFIENANFYNTEFKGKNLNFINTVFNGIADFDAAEFNCDSVLFNNAIFDQIADFGATEFKAKNINFRNIEAPTPFNMTDAVIAADNIDFENSTFRSSNFENAIFDTCTVNFNKVEFKGTNDFTNTQFNGHVDFSRSQFNPYDMLFDGAYFDKGATLLNIPPGKLESLFANAYYKEGTRDLFILPDGMLFENLGLQPIDDKNRLFDNNIDENERDILNRMGSEPSGIEGAELPYPLDNTPKLSPQERIDNLLEKLGNSSEEKKTEILKEIEDIIVHMNSPKKEIEKDNTPNYESLGIEPPVEGLSPQEEIDALLEKLNTAEAKDKPEINKRLGELYDRI